MELRSVPRIGRVLDLVGVVLFATGGGLFAWAWNGFRGVREYQASVADGPWAAVRLADEYWRLQKIGTALMVAAVVVFVSAWWVAGRARQRADERASDSDEGAGSATS